MSRVSGFLAKRAALIVLVLVSMAAGALLYANYHGDTQAYAVDQATAARADGTSLLDIQNAFAAVAEKVGPAVVNITSEKKVEVSRSPFDDFFRDFPGFPGFPFPRSKGGDTVPRYDMARGSGVIVRSDGYILTNDHVVGGADRVTVKLKDGREFKGTVLRDPRTDLALVKIDARNLPTAELADSDKVRVGQWAIALGNPYGLDHTLTVGVVSAVTREFTVPDPESPGNARYYPDAIQTDASINPGNSGGPLVDIFGRVIGINAAILSPSGGNIGVGFAIPSNTAKFVMDQLIEKGKVTRGYLGLMPADLTPVQKEKFGVKEGAVVQSVDEDTPAADAGIKPMDVITEFNGQKVKDALDLRRKVAATPPGTKVKVTVYRDRKPIDLTVKLGEAPDLAKGEKPSRERDGDTRIGLRVETVTPEIARDLELKEGTKGVVVRSVEAGSPADRAGIEVGDVILKVDQTPIKDVASFRAAIGKLKSGDTALLLVQTKGRTRIVEVTID